MFQVSSPEFQLAVFSVLKAGKIVRDIYNSSFEVSWKAKDDPLTEADLLANKEILSHIKESFPDDGILSEEIADNTDRLSKDRVWILDPIDGTREFVQKNPEFSISLGLSYQGKAILGIVFNPITRELISGIVDLGISYLILDETFALDPISISLSKLSFKESIQKPSVYVSRSEFQKDKLFDANSFWKESFSMLPIGSIAYKLALTAAGKGDLSISLKPKNEWDICAGVALVEASGGKVIDLFEQTQIQFNSPHHLQKGILAGNPYTIESLVSSHGKFLKDSLVNWN